LCASATTSLFSGAIDYPVESQFRKDPSGGLAFLLLGPRKNGYFVASKPEEERKRGRKDQIVPQAVALINLLICPIVYLPGFV
jgi:hypothetical protein